MNEFQTEATNPAEIGKRIGILILIVCIGGFGYWYFSRIQGNDPQIQAAMDAFREQEFDAALMHIDEALEIDPDDIAALLLGANFARQKPDLIRADNYLKRIKEDSPQYTNALLGRGHIHIQMGDSNGAEDLYKQAIPRIDPTNLTMLEEGLLSLSFIYRIEGRNWELARLVEPLLHQNRVHRDLLFPMAGPDKPWVDEKEYPFIQECLEQFPDDRRPELGRIRQAIAAGRKDGLGTLLEAIITMHPTDLESRLLYGGLILEAGTPEQFLDWNSKLDDSFESHPDTWHLRGIYCEQQGNTKQAVRCFWESLRRDPHHRRSCFRLLQGLKSLGETELAAPFEARFALLDELGQLMLYGDDSSNFLTTASLCRVVEIMVELGRLPEALSWCSHIESLPRGNDCIAEIAAELKETVTPETPLNDPEKRLEQKYDLSRFPLPEFSQPVSGRSVDQPEENTRISDASFFDVAQSVGLDFRFIRGAAHAGRMFAFSGGGAGVIDFDHDDWPDLYLSQGNSTWPASTQDSSESDRLFRNLNGQGFMEVTQLAGLEEQEFGQGVCVADYDEDGFPDLFVCNLGRNRLFRNNGDGTYSEAIDAYRSTLNQWTSSAVIADLNLDGAVDLYEVNYLASGEAWERVCEINRQPAQCPVNYFPAAPDQIFWGDGTGGFQQGDHEAFSPGPAGKGMGAVAYRMAADPALSLFIANDTTPNFLLQADASDMPVMTWRNNAAIRGVALSGRGDPQSCMGVAVADLDGDSRQDLIVTNFILEPSNLYLQKRAGLFEDQVAQREFRQSSNAVMGWGVQILDADLDGRMDALVANGHLDRNTAGDAPFRMPTQFLHNQGSARMLETNSAIQGAYGKALHAGRSIARLDWNRDGRDDAVVTHLDEPVALLENRETSGHHSLQLRLSAIETARDAIGTIVEVEAGDQRQTLQLTAGDGFQASNERTLTVGLGPNEQAQRVVIHWPGGNRQVIDNLPADSRWLIVENRAAWSL